MTTMSYHKPVLLEESIQHLNIQADGTYVDVTFGGGGHSRAILAQLGKEGKLIAFDQDPDAQENKIEDERVLFIPQNFRYMKNYLQFYNIDEVDGILADLGVSSHQFNEAERGFSTRFEGPLDMRMNPNQKRSAHQVVNEFSEEELADILYQYGELRDARKAASIIVNARIQKPIESTSELTELFNFIPERKRNKYLAQVFQAIRIFVNEELDVIKDFLPQTHEVLKADGRLVVISYHSLEDRLVKRYLKTGQFEGEPERDVFGNWFKPWTLPFNKAIIPNEEEIAENPRARSAKMRVGIKNE